MKKIYLLIIGLMLCFNIQAQLSQINDSSMYGGKIRDFAKNSSSVLVATEGGIFKTINEGLSWTSASQNFDPYSIKCDKIVSIGNDFYAMTQGINEPVVYKSTDNGGNWLPVSIPSWWVQSIGKISNTLYAVGGDMNGGRIYATTDGSNWIPKANIWSGNWPGGNLELLSFNQSKLYLSFNDSLFYTTDGNSLINISANGLSSPYVSSNDDRVDGDASGNIYYRDDNAIFKYNFTSQSWINISSGKIPSGYTIIDFSVTDNAIFLNAFNPAIDMKLFKSTNQGTTFTELTATGLTTPMIGNIIEVSANGFIGNALDDRIIYSTNGGNTWTSNNNQFIATSTANLTKSGNSLLFSREPKGIIRSTNQGQSWNAANNGIPGLSNIAYFINEIYEVKDSLFAFAFPDPFNNISVLYKSSNNATSWSAKPIPPPYDNGEDYYFAGKCDSALFVSYFDINSSNYALIATFNNGNSWVKPSSQNTNDLIYLKGPKNCLFAFYDTTNGWDDFSNISKTTNFGTSFVDLNTNGFFNSNFQIKRQLGDRYDKGEAMMDFNTATNKAIFVIRDRTISNGIDKLYLYDITSNTWSQINTLGLPANYYANTIKYAGNNLWLLATNLGLYKSTNNGVDWTLTHNTSNWPKGMIVNKLQLIGNKVFLGTIGNGLWIVDMNVGIAEQLKENNMQIFPNPTNNTVTVGISSSYINSAKVSVYDMQGKEVINTTTDKSEFSLDLSNLLPDVYLIVVSNNNKIFRKTIIRK